MHQKLLGFVLIITSTAAVGQSPLPPSNEDDPIIVTGTRSGNLMLSVDFEKVAIECNECKRVLSRMQRLQSSHAKKKGEIERDSMTMNGATVDHTRTSGDRRGPKIPDGADFLDPYASIPEQKQSRRLASKIPDHLRKDQAELGVIRSAVNRQVASFLVQLEPYVVAASEAERIKRKASAVIRADRRAKRVKAVDITRVVISRLNAMQFSITLPETSLPDL